MRGGALKKTDDGRWVAVLPLVTVGVGMIQMSVSVLESQPLTLISYPSLNTIAMQPIA